jgi:hypothetical protein
MPPALPSLLAPLLLGACAVESELTTKTEPAAPDTSEPDDSASPPDSEAPEPPAEECNGVDDDGDGATDEGFPDADANGRVDCLDATCPPLSVGTTGALPIVAACAGTPSTRVASPWSPRTLWTLDGVPDLDDAHSAWSMPAVVQLDDDNVDGTIDGRDRPEVAVVVYDPWTYGFVMVLDGATGAVRWTWGGAGDYAGVIAADVDADGVPEVLTFDVDLRVVALRADGTELWRTASTVSAPDALPAMTAADLEGDGTVEVIADDLLIEGATGAERARLAVPHAVWYRLATAADTDLDGVQEIHLAGRAFAPDGTLLWDSGETGPYGFWPVIVNADGDPEAEIGWVGDVWTLWDDDGTRLHRVDYTYDTGFGRTPAHPGPPCVADFDGDGVSEVAWASQYDLFAFELDGTPMWTAPVVDATGLAGCSAWDVDADGRMEILYADEQSFTIFDGATGRMRWSTMDHYSITGFEYPTVADVDGDGDGEILTAGLGGFGRYATLRVYTHDGPGWAPASTHWPIHDYAVTNATENGGVPATPEPWWLTHNVFRARLAVDDPGTADLLVTFTDVCVADCTYGPVSVALQVGNQGGADVPAGATLALYAQDDASARLLRTVALPAVPEGTLLEGVQLDLAPGDVGTRGFRAVVNDPATRTRYVHDCDTSNDVATWSDGACP